MGLEIAVIAGEIVAGIDADVDDMPGLGNVW